MCLSEGSRGVVGVSQAISVDGVDVEIIEGVVTDVLERNEVDQYVVPEATLYGLHEGEKIAGVDPHPDHWSRRIPSSIDMFAGFVAGLLPASLRPRRS